MPDEFTMSVGVSRDEIEDVLAGLRAGGGLEDLEALRRRHGAARANILNLLWREGIPEHNRRAFEHLLAENRLREDYINRSFERVMDDRHAERMAEIAKVSNRIAQTADNTAQALKRWTVVLAVATVVLAGATIALIWATVAT